MCTMLLIPLIPIAALVTQNMIILNNIIVRKADLQDSDLSVVKSDEQVNIFHYFGVDIVKRLGLGLGTGIGDLDWDWGLDLQPCT